MNQQQTFFKEYKNIEKINLDEDYLIISPTGKIFKLNPSNLKNEFISYLDINNVNYNEVMDKICEEFYARGYEIESMELEDIKKVIESVFGYVIYNNEDHLVEYSNVMYRSLTNIQKEIISKLNEMLNLKGDELLCKNEKHL